MILFLDIDGVLNDHTKLESGYCGISQPQVRELNRILDALPDLKIVLTSAWRYKVIDGDMTLGGFEYLLLVHGIKAREPNPDNPALYDGPTRLHGITAPDPWHEVQAMPPYTERAAWEAAGLRWRNQQILDYVKRVSTCSRCNGQWRVASGAATTTCPECHATGKVEIEYIVLDDLALEMDRLVKTEPEVGLTAELADEVIECLRAQAKHCEVESQLAALQRSREELEECVSTA